MYTSASTKDNILQQKKEGKDYTMSLYCHWWDREANKNLLRYHLSRQKLYLDWQ